MNENNHAFLFKTTIVIVIVGVLGLLTYMTLKKPVDGEPVGDDVVMCTADAMLCPDGTYVGRTGPSCQFVCPTPVATSTSVQIDVKIGQMTKVFTDSFTVLEIVEDSRCPVDVQCIQAGTVRLNMQIVSGMGTSTKVINFGETVTTESESITFTKVLPIKKSTVTTRPSDYVFTFEVKKR